MTGQEKGDLLIQVTS